MPNEIITESGLAVALGVKLIHDVCGPTAKYLGGEFASYTETGIKNLKRVFENAAKRISQLNKTEGQVPPRVLKGVLSEGYFCEDEIQAAYLGGVLASSKAPLSRDDRAVAYCSIISSLSTYQLRTHFILYAAILRGPSAYFPYFVDWLPSGRGVTVRIAEREYQAAMEFSSGEQPSIVTQHAFVGLEKHGLLEGGLKLVKDGDFAFRFFYPTVLGVELFLWGLGVGDRGLGAYTPELLDQLPVQIRVKPFEIVLSRVSW